MATPLRTPRRKNSNIANNLSTPLFVCPSPQLQELGYGTGVHVYRIERSVQVDKIRSPWVVKRLRGRLSESGHAELIAGRLKSEAEILRRLDHPNIVGYRGTKVMPNQKVALAMEHCDTSLGNILEIRMEDGLGPLDSRKILKMSLDVCKALDYLHSTAHILHGDLKSFNVLIKGDFDLCKLCDFGVSLPLNSKGYVDVKKKPDAEYTGTNLWSAPEVFDCPARDISSKADIFSFGLIIYETIALQAPHTDHLVTEEEPPSMISEPQKKKLCFDEDEMDLDTLTPVDMENQSPNVSNSLTNESVVSISSDRTANASILDSTGPNDSQDDPLEPYLGTRPLIPSQYDLSADYNKVMEIFFICTKDLAEDRPSANYLAGFLDAIVSSI